MEKDPRPEIPTLPPDESKAITESIVRKREAEVNFFGKLTVGFRVVMVTAVVLAACALGVSIASIIINVGTSDSSNEVLSLAKPLTTPEAQYKQVTGFLGLEAAVFKMDCVAKAHQLTIINNNQGGTVTEPQLEAECARIAVPFIPPPKK